MVNKKILFLCVGIVLFSSYGYCSGKKSVKVLSDNEKLENSFASVKEEKVILIKGKNIEELVQSFQEALSQLDEEQKKDLVEAVKEIVKRDINLEKKTLINRKLTKEDIRDIKFNALNGKTVLDIIGEGNEIKEKREKEQEKRKLKRKKSK